MPTLTFTEDQIDALGAKLATFDDQFTFEERALLRALLLRGVAGLREDDGEDVSGFIGMLLPAVQKVREAANRNPSAAFGGGVNVAVGDVNGDRPAESMSLNFTKIL